MSSAPADQSGPASAEKPKLVIFHRLVPSARLPMRADRSGIGTIPTRAFRYCEALTTAASFGYYIFPPMAFRLLWTGGEVMWNWQGEGSPAEDEWLPLHTVQFPGFRPQFDAVAPEEIREFSPPFLTAMMEPGIVQVWSGLVARTAPGVSMLVRPPANLPRSQYYDFYEGIIETDRWFGPLFINLRLTKTNTPISFSDEFPLFQVQPLPRDVYDDATLNNYELVPRLDQFQPEDWDDFYDTVVRPHVQSHRPRGQYATAARKRRAQGDDGASG